MNADGSYQHPVGSATAPSDSPAWSPDGTQLAFDRWRNGPSDRTVYLMNADGSAEQSIATIGSYGDTQPAWSPDGKRLALAIDNLRGVSIAIVNLSGGGVEWIAAGDSPAWRP
jgi:TolB protein